MFQLWEHRKDQPVSTCFGERALNQVKPEYHGMPLYAEREINETETAIFTLIRVA